mgnify:CR=1 FL=1
MKRSGILFIAALAALLGSLTAAWGTMLERDRELRGFANPAANAQLPFFMPRLGINADLTTYHVDELTEEMLRIQAAGILWIRQPFNWMDFQPDSADVARYQPLLDTIRQSGELRLIAVLSDPDGTPPELEAFSAAAGRLASQYGDLIDIYQVWDEPNLGAAWGGEPRVAEYAALLNAAYTAIHSNDAHATVLTAALAPTLEINAQNISDLVYLDALYRLGLRDFSDGIAAKPYGFDFSPTEAPDPHVLNFGRLILLREIMEQHKDHLTPLWASEWGWNALPVGWQGSPSIWGSVTQEMQVEYTLEALSLVETRYPWVGGMILSSWQPRTQPADSAQWGFALRSHGGSPTTLYSALVAAQAARQSLQTAAPVGLHHARTPYAEYSGVWTLGDFGADIGWVGDSQVAFTFRGDALSLLVREGGYTGYLYITVDDKPANALPLDSNGDAYLLLTSDTLLPETRLTPVARNLGDGVHRARIRADRGWDQWALMGFAVGTEDKTAPYHHQIALAALSACLAGISMVIFGRQISWLPTARVLHGLLMRISEARRLMLAALASLIMMTGLLMTWRDAAPEFLRREPVQLGLAIASAGLLYLNPAIIISIVCVVILLILFCYQPLHGLMLTLIFAPFFLFPVELYRFAFPMSELLVLITFAAWLFRAAYAWAQRRQMGSRSTHSFQWSRVDLFLAAYVAIGIVTLIWTEYRQLAITELRTLFLEPVLFYIVLRAGSLQGQQIRRLIDALIISGVLVAGIGLFLYVRGEAIITAEDGVRRLASVYGSPNNVALWLGRCLPFALALVLSRITAYQRWLYACACALLVITIMLTFSAGAIALGIPAILITIVPLSIGRRSLLPLAGLVVATVAALPFTAQFPRFARLFDPSEGTNFFRVRVWQSAIALIRDHPITGIGQDQFLNFFRGRYILPDAWQEPNLSHPHNFVLDIWLRLGIVGVLLFTALFGTLLHTFWRLRMRFRHDPSLKAVAIGALGATVHLLVHGLVDNSLFVNDLIYAFMLLCGLAVILDQHKPTENDASSAHQNMRSIDVNAKLIVK